MAAGKPCGRRGATTLPGQPVAREPAPALLSGGSAASGGTGGQWQPNAQPGYQAAEGALYRQLLETPAAETPRVPAAEPAPAPRPAPAREAPLAAHSQSFGRVLTIIAPDMALLERDGKLLLLALPVAERWLKQAQLQPGDEGLKAQPLLIPVRLKIPLTEE